MEFKKDKYYLVYLEKHLIERWITVEYGEYDREILTHDWETFIGVEEFANIIELYRRVVELVEMVDYDFDIKFIGVFEGNRLIEGPRAIMRKADELLQKGWS